MKNNIFKSFSKTLTKPSGIMTLKYSKKALKSIIALNIFFYSIFLSANNLNHSIDKEKKINAKFEYSVIKVNDIDISYVDIGEGTPIIFLHGWSSNSDHWQKQMTTFSNTHRVVAYDFRGMGRSTGGDTSYNFSQLTDDLKRFIDKLGLDNPILVGHSQGAVTAIYFAAKYPERVKGIISANAPGDNIFNGEFMHSMFKASTSALSLIISDESILSTHTPILERLFYSNEYRKNNPKAIDHWRNQYLTNSPESLVNAMGALSGKAILTDVTVNVPAVFIEGTEDSFYDINQSVKFHNLFSNFTVELLEDIGHMSSEETPNSFNKIVENFISRF